MTTLQEKLDRKFSRFDTTTAQSTLQQKLDRKFSSGAKSSEPQGFFMKAMDILSRPLFTVAGGVKAVVEGDNVLQEAYKGFTGQERDTFSDVFNAAGWKPTSTLGKVLHGLAGFAADVAFDPLTYLGVGALTKIGKTAESTGTLAKTIGAQSAAGQRGLLTFAGKSVLPKTLDDAAFNALGKFGNFLREGEKGVAKVTSPVIQAVGKAMSTKFRPKGISIDDWTVLRDATIEAKNIKNLGTADARTLALDLEQQISDIVTTGKFNRPQVNDLLHKIESKAMNIPQELQPLHKKLITFADDISRRRGFIGKEVFDNDQAYNYWIHSLSDSEKNLLQKTKVNLGDSRVFSTKTGSDITRKYVKFGDDILDVNSGRLYNSGNVVDTLPKLVLQELPKTDITQATIKEINTALGREFFDQDIPRTAFEMGKRMSDAEAGTEFMNRIRTIGVKDTVAPDGFIAPKVAELKGLKFQPEVAEQIEKTLKAYSGKDESVNGFLKMYDNVQNFWKGSATYVNPAFHSRNAMSNVWQNFLADVKNPARYIEAGKIMSAAKNGEKVAVGKIDDVWREFQRQGLGGTGWFSGDIARDLKKEIGSTNKFNPFGMTRYLGSTIEDHAKLTHFIDKLEKGFTPKAAAESVRKYLFDYQDLTGFEQKVLKRIFPFYTWTRNNFPLQVEELIKNPGKFGVVAKGITEIDKGTPGSFDIESMPDWLQDGVIVKLWGDDKKVNVVNLEGFIPSADIQLLSPREFYNRIFEMLTPIVKAPIEQFVNFDFFFRKELERYPGQSREFLRFITEPVIGEPRGRLVHLLKQFRPLSEVDKLIKREYNPVKKKYEDPSWLQIRNRLINWGVGGKVYEIFPDLEKETKQREKKKLEASLKGEIKFAKKSGKIDQAQRLAETLRELQKKK